MTDNIAKTKWCPMSRYVLSVTGELISNRQGHVNDPWDSCLVSDCMMWRWLIYENDTKSTTEGYCGLGGKP